MKTMNQMHEEILRKARWDGGWPRAVIVGPGVVALARDKAHYDKLKNEAMVAPIAGVVIAIVALVVLWGVI